MPQSLRKKVHVSFDRLIGSKMQKIALPMLRFSLGIVYLWFGFLKIFNVSPIAYIIKETYTFLPYPEVVMLLGIWEVLIGLGLIFKKFVRTTIVFLWLQMLGILGSAIIKPSIFFGSNPLILTVEGEFLLKNLIMISASIVIVSFKQTKE